MSTMVKQSNNVHTTHCSDRPHVRPRLLDQDESKRIFVLKYVIACSDPNVYILLVLKLTAIAQVLSSTFTPTMILTTQS